MKISPMPRSRDQLVEDAQHLRLHRHVERRGRLVGDQQLRLGDQHHRDHHALAHAARDLVRIELVDALAGRGCCTASSIASARCRASPRGEPLVQAAGLGDLLADGHHRVQREFRILHDHRDAAAADVAHRALRQAQQVDAVEGRAGRRATVAGSADQARGCARPVSRLARAAFADDAEPLAAEREGDAAHRLDGAARAWER